MIQKQIDNWSHKQKRKIGILGIVFVLFFSLFGCGALDEDYQNLLKDDVYANYESFQASMPAGTTEDHIIQVLESWAEDHSIYCKELAGCGLMMRVSSTEGYEDAPSLTYQCPIDTVHPSITRKTAAIALTVLSDTRNHGTVTLLFTRGTKGAIALPKKYLKTDHFIALTERTTPRLFTGSAATAEYEITRSLKLGKPQGSKAYEVNIHGLSGGDASLRDTKHLNPIVEIGSILKDCRDEGLVIELGSFSGGKKVSDYPSSAKALLTVNASEAGKLLSLLESARDQAEDQYRTAEPDLHYEISEVAPPKRVINTKGTSAITTLLYTLPNGIYATDEEDDIQALSNIGSISTGNKTLSIGTYVRSIDSGIFDEMKSSYQEIASLSDASLEVVSTIPIWPKADDSALADLIIMAGKQADLSLSSSSTFMQNDASAFYAKDPDLSIVALGVTMTDAQEITETLVLFTEGFGTPSQTNLPTE